MDASAHLQSLGWLGPGHPLHPSSYKQKGHRGLAYDPNANNSNPPTTFSSYPSNGLIKPLLISQKQNNLGLGRKAHEPQQGTEWWLKGFEKALGDVGKSESERSSGVSTPVFVPGKMEGDAGRFGRLYSFFVRGGEMEGTIDDLEKSDREMKVQGTSRKNRKSDEMEDEVKRDFDSVAAFLAVRDKNEKRRKRKEKNTADNEFKAMREFMEVREGKQSEKRKSDTLTELSQSPVVPQTQPKKKRKSELPESTTDSATETKEERKARRRQTRDEKQAKKAGRDTNRAEAKDHDENEDSATKALRKAEKKKRKAQKTAHLKVRVDEI